MNVNVNTSNISTPNPRQNAVLPTIAIDLILDRLTLKDVLRGVLHSILFHRLFGTIKPKMLEILDVTMPGISDPTTERLINEKVEAFWKGIEGGMSKRGEIIIILSEKKIKKNWFSIGEEDVPWEQWVVSASLHQSSSPPSPTAVQQFHSSLSSTLTRSLMTMVEYTSSEKGRAVVPPITDANGISPFPFRVVVRVGGVEVG